MANSSYPPNGLLTLHRCIAIEKNRVFYMDTCGGLLMKKNAPVPLWEMPEM